jgi:hypothetical protein
LADVYQSGFGNSSAMTTTPIKLISSTTPRELWSHPTLDLFLSPIPEVKRQEALLFTTPTTFGESFEEDDQPVPTSESELPDIRLWTMAFATNVLEILAGRRQPSQIAARCHPIIFRELLLRAGRENEIGKIRKIHQDKPLDGLCESVLTIRFGDRLRPMVIRTEGINGRWICTALRLMK